MTKEGWLLLNPSQATITPADPGKDTRVVYVKLAVNEQTIPVQQTVEYRYADGVTTGRPILLQSDVQKV